MRTLPLVFLLACTGTDEPESTPVVCDGDDGGAVTLTIAPYVQAVSQTSATIMWETDEGTGSRVEFGASEALGSAVCGELVGVNGDDPEDAPTQVHTATLTDLAPGETVYYAVRTGQTESAVAHFRTVPDDPEASVRLVAMSDSQLDERHPEKFTEVIQDGVLPYARANWGEDLAEEVGLVVFPGDLVDNGWRIEEWQDEFFAPAAELFAQVPVYPAIGNHEGGSPHYFRYFDMPGDEEHYYTTDYANLRVVALDSNGYAEETQLAWLDGVLAEACDDADIDFVFAQLHHPARSELWLPGESDFTATVAERLGAFSTACGKPSIHFFGHTHGYSRGQLPDHQHLMVNVASAGGGLDRWGEQSQNDYADFSVSQDTYGFVTVEVEAGDAPKFTMTRVNRGTPETPLDNVVSDQITLWRDNDAPATPTVDRIDCAGPGEPRAVASAYSDPESHAHQAAEWQVAADCGFTSLVAERWRQDKNEYMGVDTQAGDDLADEVFAELGGLSEACVRVRYRDEGLRWSAWSTGALLAVPVCE
ncbi:MAG: metallophosphoesterase family protein [Deltaproteobacteria bacterium]|nr:MAG: metallophosphoesterase family protein [Deltaproteobacteria bacterium]